MRVEDIMHRESPFIVLTGMKDRDAVQDAFSHELACDGSVSKDLNHTQFPRVSVAPASSSSFPVHFMGCSSLILQPE